MSELLYTDPAYFHTAEQQWSGVESLQKGWLHLPPDYTFIL